MRTHRNLGSFVCWRNKALLQQLVSAENLQVARMEPVIRQLHGAVGIDLTFAKNGRYAVVPFVNVEASMLTEREKSPFIWPASVADAAGAERLEEIEALILPWLESLSLGKACNDERIRRFGDDDDAWALFNVARDNGFLGAAPYRSVMRAVAPYVYAVRFTDDASIAIEDPNSATGAVILSRYARMVRANLGSADLNAAASQWFASPVFSSDLPRAGVRIGADASQFEDARVRITTGSSEAPGRRVSVAAPIPYDVMVSFDLDDAPEIASFHVDCAVEAPLRRPIGADIPAALGGSGGNVLFLLRDDWKQAPDADVDDALALARRLRAEGFSVDVAGTNESFDVAKYDLVHAFAIAHAAKMLPHLRAAAERGVPRVVTSALEDLTVDATWGIGMCNLIFKSGTDEETLADHLQLFSEHRLETELFNPKGQAPYAGYETDVRAALALANAVLTSGPAEEAFVRERFGYAGYAAPIAPYLDASTPPIRTETLVGTGGFVLSHAPIQPRANPLILARAAMAANVPLVFCGPVADTDVYSLLREMADERIMFVPAPDEAELEALYRRARVFTDVSWAQYGAHRIARAAVSGCSLVVSSRRYAAELWRPGMWLADPASVDSIAATLRSAWATTAETRRGAEECARRVATACDPVASLVGTVSAYAAASQAPVLNYAPV